MRATLFIAVVMLIVAPLSNAAAQSSDAIREGQMRMLELQRTLLLSMADSMPERLYRDAATPGQRDFARQVHHAAGGAVGIASRFAGGSARPELPDTATALNSRAGLKSFVNAAFDHCVTLLESETDAQRAEKVQFFGKEIPRWQVWDEIHQHTIWTAGQVVANFRKHGMAPPGFGFF